MMRHQFCAITLLAAIFAATTIADEPNTEQKIKVLKVDLLQKHDWNNVGFKTPQATAQTFLWATREGNTEMVRKCFDRRGLPEFTDEDKKRMKEAAKVATGYQPLAIRKKDEKQLELKFKVEGWQDRPFVHPFKLIDDEWKIDPLSNTRTAEW